MMTKSFNRPKQYGGLMRRSSSQRSSFTPGMSACTTPDQSSIPGQQDGSVPEESFDLSDEDISQQCKFSLCKEIEYFQMNFYLILHAFFLFFFNFMISLLYVMF